MALVIGGVHDRIQVLHDICHKADRFTKNPAFRRRKNSWPIRKVELKQFLKSDMIFLFVWKGEVIFIIKKEIVLVWSLCDSFLRFFCEEIAWLFNYYCLFFSSFFKGLNWVEMGEGREGGLTNERPRRRCQCSTPGLHAGLIQSPDQNAGTVHTKKMHVEGKCPRTWRLLELA